MKKNNKIEKLEWESEQTGEVLLQYESGYRDYASLDYVLVKFHEKLDEVIDRLNEMEEKK